MTERLIAAFDDAAGWLKRFDRLNYEKAFQEYCERFLPPYRAAVAEAGEAGIPALAKALLDAMEARWRAARVWNRTQVRVDIKQVLTFYLTPMLLREPALHPLAAALRDGWNSRWPKETYHAASYETIRKGFKWVILGIEIPEKKKEGPPADEV